jgi:CTP synthase
MRLGSYPCALEKGTKAAKAYKTDLVRERHRHRYEVNNAFIDSLKSEGLMVSGICPDNDLVEMVELPDHPWFVGCQFHPELRSRATTAHPLFRDFVKAAMDYSAEYSETA